jgi:CubicO group peptidase (beta-lactamase class C family)
MAIDLAKLQNEIAILHEKTPFSGVVYIWENGAVVMAKSYGFANRAEAIPNKIDTRFGVASAAKVFTGVAICQLVEKGLLSFDTPLKDCVGVEFPQLDPAVTVHHLLTHTSGIPDYFDEDVMDDFEALWRDRPMYSICSPKDFLPLFQHLPMKFLPGEKFSYNNGAFVVLGLIVEHVTGLDFTEYVAANILAPCRMQDSGYFAMDRLPARTAYGYIDEDGGWRTNIYSVPIIGGPDGGIFVTAPDLAKFWDGLFGGQLLSQPVLEKMLTPHVATGQRSGNYYGYAIWINRKDDGPLSYFITGQDPGVSMLSAVYPDLKIQTTVISNTSEGAWPVQRRVAVAL